MKVSFTTKKNDKPDNLILTQNRLADGNYLITAYAVDKNGRHCIDFNGRVYFTAISGGNLLENLGTPLGSSVIEMANGKVSLLHNKALCKAFLNNLSSDQIGRLQHLLEQNIKGVGGASPGRMQQLQKNLSEGNFSDTLVSCLPVQRCYLYWVNPTFQLQNG